MKKYCQNSWPFFFFLLGAISILGQTVILREITALFYGNEMFYGLGLSLWLFFTGLGSLFAHKIRLFKKEKVVWLIQASLFFLLPILIICLRFLVSKLTPPGQSPDFWLSLTITQATFFIFCFPLGMLFSLASSIWSTKKDRKVVNQAYFWETLGFIFAGTFFSFILSTTSFPFPSSLEYITLKWRYPNLEKITYSKYNQLLITKTDTQRNFILSGQLGFITQESLENQQLLSLITPFVKDGKKVLILGNPNLAREASRMFSSNRINFLEVDDKLLEMEKEIFGEKINPILEDPRRFLNKTKEKWDLIIFSIGNPQTLLTNRYYTKENFWEVKKHLEEKGIFTLLLYLPTDYQSKEALLVGSSIYKTLTTVFPEIILIIPEEQLLFLSSDSQIKLDEKKINPVWQDFFWYNFKNRKREEILEKLENTSAKINTDYQPIAFFYQQLFWQTIFSFKLPKYIQKVSNILPIMLFTSLLFFFVKSRKKIHLGFLMACGSFILMCLETLIIFLYQIKIGYLYSQISLLFALVLLGMGLGVRFENYVKKKILGLNICFLGYLLILLLLLKHLEGVRMDSFQVKEFANSRMMGISEIPYFWWAMALSSGIFGGGIFALVNNLYLKKSKNVGYIYAYDLFGAFLGALLTTSLFLPVYGIKGLLFGLTMGVLLSLSIIVISKHPG